MRRVTLLLLGLLACVKAFHVRPRALTATQRACITLVESWYDSGARLNPEEEKEDNDEPEDNSDAPALIKQTGLNRRVGGRNPSNPDVVVTTEDDASFSTRTLPFLKSFKSPPPASSVAPATSSVTAPTKEGEVQFDRSDTANPAGGLILLVAVAATLYGYRDQLVVPSAIPLDGLGGLDSFGG
jgi:hypothetical protein